MISQNWKPDSSKEENQPAAQAPAPLVRLPLRGGEAIAEARLIEGAEVYFCAKDRCPHYQGQLGLLAEAATMYCALVHYPPDRTCQPFYLEAAEDLDQARRQTWQERLEEAEAFEKSLVSASPSSAVANILPFRPPSPAPRGRAGEGATTPRKGTP